MMVVGRLLLLLLLLPLGKERLAARDDELRREELPRDELPRTGRPPPTEPPLRTMLLPLDEPLRDALPPRDELPPPNEPELREADPRLEKLEELRDELKELDELREPKDEPPTRPALPAAIAGSAGPRTKDTARATFAECLSHSCQFPSDKLVGSSSCAMFGLARFAAPAFNLAMTGEANAKFVVRS